MMNRKIPQRELRNNIGEVLRQAEAGTEFTITVRGRPVARLGPADHDEPRTDVPAETVKAKLATTPVDPRFASDLRQFRDLEEPVDDPAVQRIIRALLDTSIVIAASDRLPLQTGDTAAISVITLGELQAGVRLAHDPEIRGLRQARLDTVRSMFTPLPIDDQIAYRYGDLLAMARSRRRSSKATDLLIIATASATGRTLLTLDEPQASLARAAEVAVNP